MRFAITATDEFLGVFEAFVRAGWQPLKLFSGTAPGEANLQHSAIAFAERHHAAIQLSRMTEDDLRGLRDQKCDALIVASYKWKIPDWEPYLKYAVNFHPSPLPEGRGPRPAIQAILEKRNVWAVTCHRVTRRFDEGAILASEIFGLQSDECQESLDLKIQMAAKELARRIAGPFVDLWDHAKPQEKGSYWPGLKIEQHFIDFKKPVDGVMLRIRAFGPGQSLANINGGCFIVKRAVGWRAKHDLAPGVIAHTHHRTMVIAASDGYIAVLEIEGPLPFPPNCSPGGSIGG